MEAAEIRHTKEERRQRLTDMLREKDKEYSMCMAKAAAWHRNHASAPGESFVAAMQAPTINPEAAAIDTCRSVCRTFWRAGHELSSMDILDKKRQELQARHAKFVAMFRPLDKLPGSDELYMFVYEPLSTASSVAPTPSKPTLH